MKDLIKDILIDQQDRLKENIRTRSLMLDMTVPKVQTIVGPRRAGKSSLLRLAISGLIDQGTLWDRICYVPLEDERLRADDFDPDIILQAFRELYPHRTGLKDVYFFLDEIQYLNHWEYFVNRIYEQVSRHLVITGSNSRTLHTEVASVLRGRGLAVELLPLSFTEYLAFRDIPFRTSGAGRRAVVLAAFRDYLVQGGFPEVVLSHEHARRSMLQEYFNTMLYRDILDRYQPASYRYLRYVLHRIAANTGKTLALNKIYNELKSQGYKVSKDKLYEMADLAEAIYLFKRISRYDPSPVRRENSDKKAYFIDNGLLNAVTAGFSSNFGALLENMVFWQLYRIYGNIHTDTIFYYKDASGECDFVLQLPDDSALPIQVCWSLRDQDTREREIRGLLRACNAVNSRTGIIITAEETGQEVRYGVTIDIRTAWEWGGGMVEEFEVG
ncbi:MAG TPA: ATP-binding protein [Saprospiraceae bacterium]|nr:ATP-binding protein [Saprospiraceae bacterium]